MSTKITSCPKCDSKDINELNPEIRETSLRPLCEITCACLQCNETFTISSWTRNGKRRGIRY